MFPNASCLKKPYENKTHNTPFSQSKLHSNIGLARQVSKLHSNIGLALQVCFVLKGGCLMVSIHPTWCALHRKWKKPNAIHTAD